MPEDEVTQIDILEVALDKSEDKLDHMSLRFIRTMPWNFARQEFHLDRLMRFGPSSFGSSDIHVILRNLPTSLFCLSTAVLVAVIE